MSESPAPRRGLADERTSLSWQRSILSLLVTAALALRTGVLSGALSIALPLAGALLITAAVVASRGRMVPPDPSGGRTRPPARLIRTMAYVTVACAAASVALVLATS